MDPYERVRRLGFQPCPNLSTTPEGFSLILSFFTVRRSLPDSQAAPTLLFMMAGKLSPKGCTECEQLLKDYADASLKRVRAYGNLKLANLRSNSETMEMLAEAAALADQKLEAVKRRVQEHESAAHSKNLPTRTAKQR